VQITLADGRLRRFEPPADLAIEQVEARLPRRSVAKPLGQLDGIAADQRLERDRLITQFAERAAEKQAGAEDREIHLHAAGRPLRSHAKEGVVGAGR
jgi:propanediol dehydratase small subunit